MSEWDPFDPEALDDEIPALPAADRIDRQDTATDLARRPVVRVDANICEQTGVCAQVCPEDVFEDNDGHIYVVRPENCTECWVCVENCVSGAIEIG